MTIREYLGTRLFWARTVAIGIWLLGLVMTFATDHMQDQTLRWTFFACFGAPVAYILFVIRCPRCKARLGQAMSGRRPLDACPMCGVHFDQRL